MAEALKLKDVHTPWDCRWIRVGQQLFGLSEKDQPEGLWLCARPPEPPHRVTEEDCARCEFWEPASD